MLDLHVRRIARNPVEYAIALVTKRNAQGKPLRYKPACSSITMGMVTYLYKQNAQSKADVWQSMPIAQLDKQQAIYFGDERHW